MCETLLEQLSGPTIRDASIFSPKGRRTRDEQVPTLRIYSSHFPVEAAVHRVAHSNKADVLGPKSILGPCSGPGKSCGE